jgi:hypothetical protein
MEQRQDDRAQPQGSWPYSPPAQKAVRFWFDQMGRWITNAGECQPNYQPRRLAAFLAHQPSRAAVPSPAGIGRLVNVLSALPFRSQQRMGLLSAGMGACPLARRLVDELGSLFAVLVSHLSQLAGLVMWLARLGFDGWYSARYGPFAINREYSYLTDCIPDNKNVPRCVRQNVQRGTRCTRITTRHRVKAR